MNACYTPNWKFVGGNLCLDFVNTVDGRLEQKVKNSLVFSISKDKFNGYEELVYWSKDAGILTDIVAKRLIAIAAKKVKESVQTFERALVLRESLYKIFIHIIKDLAPPEKDVNVLNAECTIARDKQKLIFNSNKFTWIFDSENDELDCMLWPIALSGAELLLSGDLDRVRQCAGDNCGWLFVDTSKNHSRQWCDMKDCGNLAKVRRFRKKQK